MPTPVPQGIRVTAINPGTINTPLVSRILKLRGTTKVWVGVCIHSHVLCGIHSGVSVLVRVGFDCSCHCGRG